MTTETKPTTVFTDTDIPAILEQLRTEVGALSGGEASVLKMVGAKFILAQDQALLYLTTAALEKQIGAENVATATPEQVEAAMERALLVMQTGLFQVAEVMPNKVTKALWARKAVQP